jgi:mannose-6-phosphate isomerase
LDGSPRDLHIGESLQCIDFEDVEPSMDVAQGETLVDCPLFKVEHWELGSGEVRDANEAEQFAIFSVVDGEIVVGGALFKKGDFFLVPASAGSLSLKAVAGASKVLRTTIPDEIT